MQRVNITRLIRENGAVPAGPAVIDGDFSASYRQLFEEVTLVKKQLQAAGLFPGQAVALLAEDSYRYIAVSLAVLELECAIIPIPVNLPRHELTDNLRRVNANWLLFDASLLLDRSAATLRLKYCRSEIKLAMVSSISPNITLPEARVPAFIRFSSGTTGRSKGVIISHQRILERITAANRQLQISGEDRILWVLDMSFHFVVTILLFLYNRATIIISGGSLPEKIAAALAKHAVTVIYATPFHYRLLTQLDALGRQEFAAVRLAISTAMKLSVPVREQFAARYGLVLTQAYGIIEVGLPFINSSSCADKFDSVGTILPDYQLRLCNCDAQGRGEINLKGPGMFDAYAEPFRAAEEVMADGWFNTGDIGYLDDDGFLFIVGRKKSMINFAGMKIFPAEIEQVMLQSQLIDEVKISALPHPHFGEIPVAEVVFRQTDLQKQEEQIRELKAFCYRQLPDYCVPKRFTPVTSIPKTASGKIIRS